MQTVNPNLHRFVILFASNLHHVFIFFLFFSVCVIYRLYSHNLSWILSCPSPLEPTL